MSTTDGQLISEALAPDGSSIDDPLHETGGNSTAASAEDEAATPDGHDPVDIADLP